MPQPPQTLTLRYCATCGAHKLGGIPMHDAYCPGTVQTLSYRLDPSGQPEPGAGPIWLHTVCGRQVTPPGQADVSRSEEANSRPLCWGCNRYVGPGELAEYVPAAGQPDPQYEYRAVIGAASYKHAWPPPPVGRDE